MKSDPLVWIVPALIALVGILISTVISVFIAGSRWGSVQSDIQTIKAEQGKAATREELNAVKETLAEIKGMFRLTLKEGG